MCKDVAYNRFYERRFFTFTITKCYTVCQISTARRSKCATFFNRWKNTFCERQGLCPNSTYPSPSIFCLRFACVNTTLSMAPATPLFRPKRVWSGRVNKLSNSVASCQNFRRVALLGRSVAPSDAQWRNRSAR